MGCKRGGLANQFQLLDLVLLLLDDARQVPGGGVDGPQVNVSTDPTTAQLLRYRRYGVGNR